MAGTAAVGRDRLICTLGTSNYEIFTYKLGAEEVTTRFAPVALARALDLAGAAATVLVTEDAERKWYASMAEELRQAGLESQALRVPLGESPAELEQIFDTLVETVGDGDRVVLDISLSLRHLPVIYLAALTYLMAHRHVAIRGVYSGAAQAPRAAGAPAPLLNLTPLVGLIRWYSALQWAHEAGDLRVLARMVATEVDSGFRSGQGHRSLGNVRNALNKLAPPLAAGLPMEVGLAARRLATALEEHVAATTGSPALRRSLEPILPWVSAWADTSGAGSKDKVPLSRAELERQLRLVEWYIERNDVPVAVSMLREWLVSFGLWRRDVTTNWLDRTQRDRMERALNALSLRAKVVALSDAERQLTSIWDRVKEERNRYAHAGMRPEEVTPDDGVRGKLREARKTCRDLLDTGKVQPASLATGGRLLVTPFGLSPGVIFTAIKGLMPRVSAAVVITSSRARARLDEALERADAADLPVTVKELADPHAGFMEAGAVIDHCLRRQLLEASDVVVNVAGGTTALQYAVEHVAKEAERLAVPLRRVAVVDRRPPEEQRADPYVEGEVVELGRQAGEQHGDPDEA